MFTSFSYKFTLETTSEVLHMFWFSPNQDFLGDYLTTQCSLKRVLYGQAYMQTTNLNRSKNM